MSYSVRIRASLLALVWLLAGSLAPVAEAVLSPPCCRADCSADSCPLSPSTETRLVDTPDCHGAETPAAGEGVAGAHSPPGVVLAPVPAAGCEAKAAAGGNGAVDLLTRDEREPTSSGRVIVIEARHELEIAATERSARGPPLAL